MDPDWASFLRSAETLAPSAGGRKAWTRGRRTYVVWALRLQSPEIEARVASVRERLAFAGLDEKPELHVTVWVAGFPRFGGPRPAPSRPALPAGDDLVDDFVDDDVDPRVLHAQRSVQRLHRRVPLLVGGASSFLSCATLAVHDVSSALARLRADLDAAAAPLGARELRFAPYTPHVTCGVYTRAIPTHRIADALAPMRELSPLRVSGTLACLAFDARVPGAPLRPWRSQ